MLAKEPFNAMERRAVLGLASLYCLRMLGLFMVLPLFAVYAQELTGANAASIGLALGAYGLTQAALQVPLGWLSDQIGRKPVILGGLSLLVLGSLVAASAETLTGLAIGRLLQGSGAIASATMALAADYTRVEQRTKASALIGASIGVSFALALVLGPVLAAWGGLPRVFEVTAVMGGLGLMVVLFWLPATPQLSDAGRAHIADRERLGEALWGRGLGIFYASIFCLHLLLMAAFTAIPSVMTDQVGLDPSHHAWLYLATLCGALPGVAVLVRRRSQVGDPRPLITLMIVLTVAGSGRRPLVRITGASWCGLGSVLYRIHGVGDHPAGLGVDIRADLATGHGDGHFLQCAVFGCVCRGRTGRQCAALWWCMGIDGRLVGLESVVAGGDLAIRARASGGLLSALARICLRMMYLRGASVVIVSPR